MKRHVGAFVAMSVLVLFVVPASIADAPALALPNSPLVASATGPSGATVDFTVTATDPTDDPGGPSAVNCTPASGSVFAIGDTTVTCSATSSILDLTGGTTSQGFTVRVSDVTPPVVTVPADQTATTSGSGAVVNFAAPTANDNVDGSLTPSCNHHSGDTFPVGQTTVACSATDAAGNTGSASFKVTVSFVDTTPPVVTVSPPGNKTVSATGPQTTVLFTASATDNVDGPLPAPCNHGTSFPVGPTLVTCSATDSSNNTGTASFTVTVNDVTPPVVTVPGPQTVGATSAAGAVVTFSAQATDNVDGVRPVTCSPPSGSTFPAKQTTTVTCSATDSSNNTGSATFGVTVVDSAPTIIGVPANIIAEANGPAGSVVTYTPPSATDIVDGGLQPNCSPASGATFPLGATTVNCSATNSSNQTATASFGVTIRDTTPPTLPVAGTVNVSSTVAVPRSNPLIAAFLNLHARDLVDPHPTVVTNAPDVFPVGTTHVTFTAIDASGNRSSVAGDVKVGPANSSSTTPTSLDRTPPGNVTGLSVNVSGRSALLRWRLPTDADFDHLEIDRTKAGAKTGAAVYKGTGTTFTDHHLATGVQYRYLIVTYDHTGNHSAGVVALAKPSVQRLYAPGVGAKVAAPVILRWRPTPKATFFNVQLYRNGRKVFSSFPTRTKLVLPKTWKLAGHTISLQRGRYDWYVWPAFGTRAKPRFAPLEGFNSFVVTKV